MPRDVYTIREAGQLSCDVTSDDPRDEDGQTEHDVVWNQSKTHADIDFEWSDRPQAQETRNIYTGLCSSHAM